MDLRYGVGVDPQGVLAVLKLVSGGDGLSGEEASLGEAGDLPDVAAHLFDRRVQGVGAKKSL
jgi:hypothetical protein